MVEWQFQMYSEVNLKLIEKNEYFFLQIVAKIFLFIMYDVLIDVLMH